MFRSLFGVKVSFSHRNKQTNKQKTLKYRVIICFSVYGHVLSKRRCVMAGSRDIGFQSRITDLITTFLKNNSR